MKGRFYLLLAIHILLLVNCSMPRIIILDDPLTPEEHINLGVIYEKQGNIDQAIEKYKKATKKIPSAYLYLGNAYFQKGDLKEAERNYKRAIKKQPDLSDAYNNLAWLYYTKVKDFDIESLEIIEKAEGFVIKALELKPANEDYLDTLNKIRERKMEMENALRFRNRL